MTDVVLTTGLDTRQALKDIDQLVALARQKFGSVAKMAAAVQGGGSVAARAAKAQASASDAQIRAMGRTIAMQRRSTAAEARAASSSIAASTNVARAAQTAATAKIRALGQTIAMQRRSAAEEARAAASSVSASTNAARAADAASAAKMRALGQTIAMQRASAAQEARNAQATARAAAEESRAAQAAAQSTLAAFNAKQRAIQQAIASQRRDTLAQARAVQAEIASANAATAAQNRLAVARTKALASADNRALNTQLRIERQLAGSADLQSQLTNRLTAATAAYRAAVTSTTPGTLAAVAAHAQLQRELTTISGTIAKTGGLLPTLSRGFSGLTGVMSGLGSVVLNSKVALAGLTAVLGFREFVATTEKLDAFRFTLQAASADSNEFAISQDFLKQKADEIGFGYADVGRAFGRFSLAVTNAGESGDTARQMFEQLAGSARNLNLSTADVTGVVRALEQSFSKGKFMAEEVRLQLGDRLPFAMQALTKAIESVLGKGVDVNKMFEQGTIDVKTYGAAFVEQLFAMSGGAKQLETTSKGMQAAFGRLSNSWADFVKAAGDAGVYDAIVSGVNLLTRALNGLAGAATKAGVALAAPTFVKTAGDVRGLEQSALDIRNEMYLLDVQLDSTFGHKKRGALEKMRRALDDALVAVEARNPVAVLAQVEEKLANWRDISSRQAGSMKLATEALIKNLDGQVAKLRAIVDGLTKADELARSIDSRTPDQLEFVPAKSFTSEDMDDLVKSMAKYDKALKEVNDEAVIMSLASTGLAQGYFKTQKAADAWAKTAIANLPSIKKGLNEIRREIDQLVDAAEKFAASGFDRLLDPISGAAIDVAREIDKLNDVVNDSRATDIQRAKMLELIVILENQRTKAVREARIEFELETLAIKRSAEQLDIETTAIRAGLDPRASVAEIDHTRTIALLELEKQTELTRIAEERRRLDDQRANADDSALRSIDDRIAALDLLKQATERSFSARSADAFRERNAQLADEFRDKWGNTISAVGDLFDDLFGALGSKLGRFGSLFQGVMLDIIRSASGSKSNSFGGVLVDIVSSTARAGGASGAGGGVLDLLSTGSSLYNIVTGGPAALATSFATSSLGTALGLSQGTAFAAGVGPMIGGASNVAAAGTAGLSTLTGAGNALAAAAGPLAIAAAALFAAYQFGVIGPNPSVGPVGIADFSPGLGRGREFEDRGVDPFTADNGGDGESMRPLAEAIATLIADTAERFDAAIDSTLRFRVANYTSPQSGSGREQGFEVNAFLTDETERRIAGGKTPEQAMFEALKFAVTEAFAFRSPEVAEAVRNTTASTTEELLTDLEYAMDFTVIKEVIEDLGGEITSSTLETARLRVAIEKDADAKAKAQVTPIVDFIKKALELFPAIAGTQAGSSGAGALAGSLRGVVMEWDEGAVRGQTPDLTFTNGGGREDPSYIQAGDSRFEIQSVVSDNREGVALALIDAAGDIVAEFDDMAQLLAGAGDALADYNAAIAEAEGPLTRTAEEQARYAANMERVGFAVDVARQSVDDLIDQITGDFEPTIRGPVETALTVARANLVALVDELEAVNDQIREANEAFPGLDRALIDITATLTAAEAALVANARSDYEESIQRELNAVTGLESLNTVSDLIDQRDVRRTDAIAVGSDPTTTADRLFEAQIRSMLEGLDASAIAAILDSKQITDEFAVNLIAEILDEMGGSYATQATNILAGIATEDLIEAELALIDTRRDEADAARDLAAAASASAKSLRSAVNGLLIDENLSPLGPEARMLEAERQFDVAWAAANDNTPMDAESQAAIQDLPGLGRSAIEAAKDYYGASTEYSAAFNRITGAMLTTASMQEDVAVEQLAVLRSIEDLLEAQGANGSDQPRFVSNGSGQFVSTGAGGIAAGLDLGYDGQRNYEIARAFTAAGIAFPGAGEGQLGTLRASNPLADAILDAMGFANGSAFSGGDVVHTATAFSMGVMGEAGPEAIMPLQRAPDGSLGVRAVNSPAPTTDRKSEQRIVAILVDKLDRMEARLAGIEANTGKQVGLASREAARPQRRAA